MSLARKRFVAICEKRMTNSAKKSATKALTETLANQNETEKQLRRKITNAAENGFFLNKQTALQRVLLSEEISDIISNRLLNRAKVIDKLKREKILATLRGVANAEAKVSTELINFRRRKMLEALIETIGEEKAFSFIREYDKNYAANLQRMDKALKQNPSP